MLKIKDDIPLEKLKEYGWEYIDDKDLWEKVPKWRKYFKYYNELYIYPENKVINGTHDETLTISDEEIIKYGWIDDLIKDDLVEKVSNND